MVAVESRETGEAPLSSQQLLKAWCERGDLEARRQLIERYLPLVRTLAPRFAGRGEAVDDLVQVGAVGLIKAVDRFDPTRGTSLAAYAVPTIQGEIRRHLRDNAHLLRLPRDREELARALALSPVSIDASGIAVADAAAERRLERGEERALIERGLRNLGRRERRIVRLRYFGGLSQRRIAAEVGLSQVHVSRLLRESLRTLRRELGQA